MDYRPLGRTGVQVSQLCLGAWQFGLRTPKADALAMIDMALAAGINFMDTASSYGNGASEEIVGEALQTTGKRARVFLATKFSYGVSRAQIMAQCEESLRRLRTDTIDLYQFHAASSIIPIDESLRALDDLIRAGKVRYIGTSNFTAWQEVEALWAASELRLARPVCSQPAYNLLDRRVERELLPMARTYGLAVIPWSPLAQGFLTGKYRRGNVPTDGRLTAEAGVRGATNVETHQQEQVFALIDLLLELAAAKGCTVSQVALAWCMQQPGVTAPIIGPRTAEQLEDNLGACAVTITAEDCRKIDAILPPGQMLVHYNRATTEPRPRW
ncbi:MAG: aldo/keto reductase [Caldilineaceae bacterium]|nr:aldo/keto reductase [Caldilineaceae bacterium]